MLEIKNYFPKEVPTSVSSKNTVIIAIRTCVSTAITLDCIQQQLQAIGTLTKSIDFIPTKSLTAKYYHDSLSAAIMLYSSLSKTAIQQKLNELETKSQLIHLEILTYNRSIISNEDVIEVPFLYDFIKNVQPEIFSYQ